MPYHLVPLIDTGGVAPPG